MLHSYVRVLKDTNKILQNVLISVDQYKTNAKVIGLYIETFYIII